MYCRLIFFLKWFGEGEWAQKFEANQRFSIKKLHGKLFFNLIFQPKSILI